MLRDLWAVSLAVRAICTGVRRAYLWWTVWSVFYLATGLLLRAFDIFRPGPHVYVYTWGLQQIGTVILLGVLIRKLIHPTAILVQYAAVFSLLASSLIIQPDHWPHILTETIMWSCGSVALWLGITSTVGTLYRFTAENATLSGFLILYSVLMLAGSDYLNSVNLGIAWSILEIVSFGAWGISRLKHKRPLLSYH